MPFCLLILSFRYDAANVKNDIAIIKLNKAVDFTRGSVGTVCLPYEYTGFGKIESLVGPPWIIGESKIKLILTHGMSSRRNPGLWPFLQLGVGDDGGGGSGGEARGRVDHRCALEVSTEIH